MINGSVADLGEKIMKAEDDPSVHPGCVMRELTVRDRMLIIVALNQGTQNGSSAQDLSRLISIRDVLCAEEIEDYYELIDRDYAKTMSAWGEAFRKYIADPSKNQDPGQRPKQSKGERVGPSRRYWIKAKLDMHIMSALKAAKFDASNAEYVVSLFETYAIPIEE